MGDRISTLMKDDRYKNTQTAAKEAPPKQAPKPTSSDNRSIGNASDLFDKRRSDVVSDYNRGYRDSSLNADGAKSIVIAADDTKSFAERQNAMKDLLTLANEGGTNKISDYDLRNLREFASGFGVSDAGGKVEVNASASEAETKQAAFNDYLVAGGQAMDVGGSVGDEAWNKLSAQDQNKLTTATSGSTADTGGIARQVIGDQVQLAQENGAGTDEIAAQLHTTASEESWLGKADASNATNTSADQKAWPTKTRTIAQNDKGKAQNQQRYFVSITSDNGGFGIPVTQSLNDPAHTMTIEQVTQSLSQLPRRRLSLPTPLL